MPKMRPLLAAGSGGPTTGTSVRKVGCGDLPLVARTTTAKRNRPRPRRYKIMIHENAAICEVVASICSRQYADRLHALILTGSMARGEATVVTANGRATVLGDAEFFLVLKSEAVLPNLAQIAALKQEISETLRKQRIECEIDLNPVHPHFLATLGPYIFSYELRVCGKIIRGDAGALGPIPAFAPGDVPLEDGWRLLSNRIIEHLASVGDRKEVQAYRTVKLYLDMVTSLLLFAGAYAPTYRERQARLNRLAKTVGEWPFPLGEFATRAAVGTLAKLGGGPKDGELDPAEALQYALLLWRWELQRLTGARGTVSSDRELIRRWMRLQPMTARMRGWLYVLRKRHWLQSWREWPRWAQLAWHASPRYCIYAATHELLSEAQQGIAAPSRPVYDGNNVWRWLPVVPPSACGQASWRRLAEDIFLNYHEFLMGTRA